MIKKVLGAIVLAALSSATNAAGDPEAGRVKANTCMGCHGIPNYTNVYPTYRVPKLGGQSEGLIVAALQAYKSGDRPHKTMHAQAASMSDQDMADIAAFLAHAPANKDGMSGTGVNSDNDKAKPCYACHGPNGSKPVLPNAPILAGQYANYIEHALHEYKAGLRKNPQMAPMAGPLSDADIEELARYFASQQSPLYTPSVGGGAQ
ncbi:MAG TPA: c-type cytochrome [Nevskiaceae bacterium]|nr:c-type cytochrome [Nevskiaceae bacterium]